MAATLFHTHSFGFLLLLFIPAFVHTQGDGQAFQSYPTDDVILALTQEVEDETVTKLIQDRYKRQDNDTKCFDKMKNCLQYVKYCTTHQHVLEGRCDRTCRYCGPRKCFDRRTDCTALKSMRECKDPEMRQLCEKTCGYCVNCADSLNPGHCLYLKSFDKCNADLRMQDFCHHTCGFCKLPEPAPCHKTKHGCCLDKITIKKTPDGNDCPACRDKFKRLCKRLQKGCISSPFVRKNCHQSCNYCPPKGAICNDDPQKTHLCKFWNKELDFCKKNPEIMVHFCPVTCGLDCTLKPSELIDVDAMIN